MLRIDDYETVQDVFIHNLGSEYLQENGVNPFFEEEYRNT